MLFYLVAVSGCTKAILPAGRRDAEKNYQINLAMKNLYRNGCRRMRVVSLPKTGDADKYQVMGWVD